MITSMTIPKIFEGGNIPEFDYIVIGAGTAGCPLAAKLLAGDPGATVLLLEAGGPNDLPDIQDFTRAMALRGTFVDWNDRSAGQIHMGNQPMPYNAGKVSGGSSSINGMVWVRGNAADYDGWAQLGNPGWDFQSVLPLFMDQETFTSGDPRYRGRNGPIYVSNALTMNPIAQDLVSAAVQMGYPFNEDYNGVSQQGVSYTQLNVSSHGIRQDAFSRFIAPHLSLNNSNLIMVNYALVKRITFDHSRTVDTVEFAIYNDLWPTPLGGQFAARPRKETIVCAGTLRSPQLLMLSGIGHADTLKNLGIQVVVDAPGVGENLHDHVISAVVRYLSKTDSHHITVMDNNLFVDGLPGVAGPGTPIYEVQSYYMKNNPHFPPNTYALGAITLHPLSRGAVTLRSNNYMDAPVIQPNLLGSRPDVSVQLSGLKMVREMMDYFAANFNWLGDEYLPGPDVTTDPQLTAYMNAASVADFHYVGTCKMGPDMDPLAVVDPQLRVRGVSGLRVADASIMPFVISGNTNAPSMMIGGRCADFILQGTS
ncbi:MAG: GMC family oxidoreductase N-terminal domain-containing protein [Chloroflexi bacterium]|nr:GMC family oxidoreductase N-terminal domain-containing protein [Chloroflexota bacterium]MCI0579282.1 GMC family oxidoreductase N-terminal domain-containing protein [Chloroflexota bacterium]MCI0644358.1 GMC family oxidoreductase N-terminal domain-containing protein [Chloroflexota bacterium]MCI0728025.1 GMC family oxidoreductase N-terminal domain-containing protein [Chloroflexota bacterium]